MVVVETHDPVISLLSHLWPVSAGQEDGRLLHRELEEFNPKGTSSQCNAFQSDNTMWGDNFFCRLGPDLSGGSGYYVLLCQRSSSVQHKILRVEHNPCADFLVSKYSLSACCGPIVMDSCKYPHFASYQPIVIEFYRAGFSGRFPSDTMPRWVSRDYTGQIVKLRQRTTVAKEIYMLTAGISL